MGSQPEIVVGKRRLDFSLRFHLSKAEFFSAAYGKKHTGCRENGRHFFLPFYPCSNTQRNTDERRRTSIQNRVLRFLESQKRKAGKFGPLPFLSRILPARLVPRRLSQFCLGCVDTKFRNQNFESVNPSQKKLALNVDFSFSRSRSRSQINGAIRLSGSPC